MSKILAPFKDIGKSDKKVKAPKSPKKEKKKEEAEVRRRVWLSRLGGVGVGC